MFFSNCLLLHHEIQIINSDKVVIGSESSEAYEVGEGTFLVLFVERHCIAQLHSPDISETYPPPTIRVTKYNNPT